MIEMILQRSKGTQRADGIVESKIITPAFSCREFAWESLTKRVIVATSVVRGFSEHLLQEIRRVSELLPAFESCFPITMMPGLNNIDHPRMQYLAMVRFPYHRRYVTWSSGLAERTLVVFPAYRSDFAGHESRKVYDELVHSRTHILEWDRPERPQIWIKVSSRQATIQGWSSDHFLPADFSDVEKLLGTLTDSADNIMVRNYRHDEMQISYLATGIVVKGLNGTAESAPSRPELLHNLWAFLIY